MFQIPLQKIDEERRLVIGQAAAECLDKSGESMDYATAKAAFQKWSAEFEATSGGLSKGNLRVMHTKEVAGKIVDLSFDDLTKAVNIVAHVASDNAWALVKSGCYGGFSIGGGYAKRWTDENGLKKYTPDVREISLVDNPCIPSARFVELIKAHGVIEHIELKPTTRPLTFAELQANQPRTFAELTNWNDDLAKAAGATLSEAQHQQRIDAAKARWAKEGGDTKAMDAHYKAQHDAAKSAWFGSKAKVAAIETGHKQEWLDLAASHEAYDKARPHTPSDAKLMIMGRGSIYDPEDAYGTMMKPDHDFSKHPVYGLEHGEVDGFIKDQKAAQDKDGLSRRTTPEEDEAILHGRGPALKKFGQHDWSEAKHPRNHGKFASAAGASGASLPPPKYNAFGIRRLGTPKQEAAYAAVEEAEQKRQDEMPARMNVAAAAAAGGAGATQLGQTLLTNRHKIVDAVKYGTGEKGVRNKTAARLRGSPLARDRIKAGARAARTEALNDAAPAGGDDLGSKAKRKVMEEATARGSSPEEAQAAGERFAEKLRNRKGGSRTVGDMFVNGKATRQVSPKAAANATRAAKNRMRGSILTENFQTKRGSMAHGSRGGIKGLMRSYALSLPLGVLGSALGAQSAWRLQREDEGHEVTPAQHRAANAGDALRVARNAGAGASVGTLAGTVGSFFHQGGSVRSVRAFLESGKNLNPAKVAAHSKLGTAIGAGVGLAASIPALARENAARRKPKDT